MLCGVVFVCILLRRLVGHVEALDCAPSSGSLAIKNIDDISFVTNCTIFTGNLVVAADGPSAINLTGLVTITGNLDIENVANLSALSSTTLTTVRSFTLNNLPELSILDFSALNNFTALKWIDLPSLEDAVMANGSLNGEVQAVSVLNTGLKKLEWLTWPVGSLLNISNNAALTTFSIPYSTINAGSAITLSDNPALSSVSLSQVSEIFGGLDIADNFAMKSLSFENLESIGGYVQLSGGFTNISMPVLDSIKGALRVEATGDVSALCSDLGTKHLSGHYDCTANLEKKGAGANATTTVGVTSTATSTALADFSASTSSSSNMISQKEKAGIAVGVIISIFLSVALTVFFLRRRSQRKIKEISPMNQDRSMDLKALSTDSLTLSEPSPAFTRDTNTPNSPMELDSPAMRSELGDGKGWSRMELMGSTMVPVEMEGNHGVSEVERGPERFELPA